MNSEPKVHGSASSNLAIIALGSNLGDSPQILREAISRLQALSEKPLRRSSLWQTAPVDCPPGSPPFLNAVVAFELLAGETPKSLLEKLQVLEKEFGRRPKQLLNAPRPLDLDLIAFANEAHNTPQLTLPHPRAHLRRFVLAPLAEIAPELVLPAQSKTVAKLLAALPDDETARRL
ncbi:MAG: 2-amino-4-hydroxy-6-hydroxymethyldihydropteridine diphosphokinase [Pedosphaera sp.]|nr:2-amino-4-hydroxy-6-hydroxymethyldihydropteridine diphosphokinase [Pedosphaera sp.]